MPSENQVYSADMARTLNRPRPAQGAHLLKLRQDAGLTQWDLARRLRIDQSTVAFWERSDKPPRSDILPAMAKALGVSVENLLVDTAGEKTRLRAGPAGKLRKAFEQAAQLPRSQQEKIVDVVLALVKQYAA
jgi:transcriptional regulator with XRE-family HTH domain